VCVKAHAGKMEKLRFGVIGIGGMAEHLAKLLQQFEDAVVVAAADTNPERKGAADALNAVFYTDYEQMLQKEALDAVVIGTPCGLHLEPTLAAAQRASISFWRSQWRFRWSGATA
jgi:UDP-N-acetyl-2-amino-2-deoxyglucuronate dehydrogenase